MTYGIQIPPNIKRGPGEQAGHKLVRSTVGAHLKALVEDRKLDSTGDGRNVWYWRREETSD